MPKLSSGDVFIYGHTHIPKAEKLNGVTIINPGSVSLPKENSLNSYGLLEDGVFYIKDLDGKTFKQINID
jgi:putative phosphoesterase